MAAGSCWRDLSLAAVGSALYFERLQPTAMSTVPWGKGKKEVNRLSESVWAAVTDDHGLGGF